MVMIAWPWRSGYPNNYSNILSRATYHRAPGYGGMRTLVNGLLAKPQTWRATKTPKCFIWIKSQSTLCWERWRTDGRYKAHYPLASLSYAVDKNNPPNIPSTNNAAEYTRCLSRYSEAVSILSPGDINCFQTVCVTLLTSTSTMHRYTENRIEASWLLIMIINSIVMACIHIDL